MSIAYRIRYLLFLLVLFIVLMLVQIVLLVLWQSLHEGQDFSVHAADLFQYAGLSSLLITLCFIFIMKRHVVRPVRSMLDRTGIMVRDEQPFRIERSDSSLLLLKGMPEMLQTIGRKLHDDKQSFKALERVRSEFLGNVSHELRTPVFTLQGYLETLLNGAVDDPSVNRKFLDRAIQQSRRLDNLLQDLMEISRIESGDLSLSLRYFDAREFVEEIVNEFKETSRDKGITLAMHEAPQEAAYIFADKHRLRQALENLISNAVKYNVPDGTVTLAVELEGESTIIRVQDSGIGIPADDIPRLFERFYRVDKTRSREMGGTGLGLAIVKHIVLAHKGSIEVQSTPGVGSTFSIRLPRRI
jgi:two-component system phosphate regulon sensor histidine kinase PhoR